MNYESYTEQSFIPKTIVQLHGGGEREVCVRGDVLID